MTTRKYAGAGSDWRFNLLSDGTFTATESETATSISGTYTTTDTGFQKLVVKSATGTQAPAAETVIGCTEIPGFAFVCDPILATEDQIVGTVSTGACPTESWTNNFLNVQFNTDSVDMTQTTGAFNTGSQYDGDLFGTFKWDVASGSGEPLTHYVVAGGSGYTTLHPTSPAITGTCDAGIMSTTSFNAYLAPNAGFVKVTETGSPNKGNGIITMPKAALGDKTAMNGDYAGFLYDATKTGAAAVVPVKATVSGTSTVTLAVDGLSKTDLVTEDADVAGEATLTAVDSPSDGFILGNIGGKNVVCMAGKNVLDSGKNALFCLGQNPGQDTKPYMLILGSK